MRCNFLYLILCDRHLRVAPQRTGCICSETCSLQNCQKDAENVNVTTRRVCVRFVSSWVVGGHILTGCYYTIECSGLRRKGVGSLADTRHILKNAPSWHDGRRCVTPWVCLRFPWSWVHRIRFDQVDTIQLITEGYISKNLEVLAEIRIFFKIN